MLIEQIREDLVTATKAKDVDTQRTLRSVIAAVQEAEVAGRESATLDDAGVQKVLKAQAKRRLDAAEAFESGGADDRAAAERAEMAIVEGYLPANLGPDELEAIVTQVFSDNGFADKSDMGAAMKAVNSVVAGRADGRAVADMVKSRLS